MVFQPGIFVRPWLTDPGDPESLRGTGPADARKALEGLLPTSGVLDGLAVTGTSAWSYNVPAGHYVINRPGQGSILAANDATVEVATDPAPGTGSRIDIIYVRHNDTDTGDPDGAPYVAVARGVASGTPAAPALPAGALELGRKTVTAGDANTSVGAAVSTANRPRALVAGTGRTQDEAPLSLPSPWTGYTGGGFVGPRVSLLPGDKVELSGMLTRAGTAAVTIGSTLQRVSDALPGWALPSRAVQFGLVTSTGLMLMRLTPPSAGGDGCLYVWSPTGSQTLPLGSTWQCPLDGVGWLR